MKIAIVQICSKKGDTLGNLKKHLQRIQTAAERKADLILFPELSLTSYEPTLAEALARDVEDPFFEPTLNKINYLHLQQQKKRYVSKHPDYRRRTRH